MDWLQAYGPRALEHFFIGCFLVDDQGICRYANKSALKYTSLSLEEIVGKHFHKVVHAQQKANHTWRSCYLLDPLKTGQTIVRKPDMLWTREGKAVWTDFSVFPIKDAHGQVEALLVSFIPGEVALRATHEHEENIKKFRALFDVSLDAKLIMTTEGKILDANRAAIRMFGSDNLTGELLVNLVDDGSRDLLNEFWNLSLTGGPLQVYAMPLKIGEKNFYVDLNVRPEMLPGQHLLVLHDVTAKTIDLKLREQFVAIVGHELKTPLTVIKAYSQLIQKRLRPEGNDKVFRYLDTVDDKVNLLTQLINTMMDFIKFGTNKIAFDDEELDWQPFILDIVQEMQRTTDKVKFIFKGKTKAKVYADRYRITQIVTNILNNARKYSPENSEVIITVSEDENWAIISVKDFGIGMTDEDMQRIYEPFFRSKSSVANNSPGLGLGLFLSKQFLNHYGGRIEVQSEMEKGSTFTIYLPKFSP